MSSPRWHGQLSHIALGCRDVAATESFYTEVLGLQEHSQGAALRRLGWGAGCHVLDLLEGADQLDHFGIEIPDAQERLGLVAAIRAHGIEVTPTVRDGEVPEGFTFADPDGRRLELHGRVSRAGEHTADSQARPVRLQHITLATEDLEATLAFYVDVLGFTVSDRMGETFAWLRCGIEHHTVALVTGPPGVLLDHFSFDLTGWSDFRAWCDRLCALGIEVSWGPGRHGPGNNLFIMFDDPDGRHIELSSEMERFFDDRCDYSSRHWSSEPRTVNLWGPTPSWREPQLSR